MPKQIKILNRDDLIDAIVKSMKSLDAFALECIARDMGLGVTYIAGGDKQEFKVERDIPEHTVTRIVIGICADGVFQDCFLIRDVDPEVKLGPQIDNAIEDAKEAENVALVWPLEDIIQHHGIVNISQERMNKWRASQSRSS